MKVKFADRFVKDKKLTEEGEKLLEIIKKRTLIMPDNAQISPVLAGLYQGIHSSLLGVGYVQYNEKQEYPLKTLCEAFLKLGIFEEVKEKKKQGVHTGHGDAASIEALGPLTMKLEEKPDVVAAEEFRTAPTDIPEASLESIDALLQKLSNGVGSLRAAIVQVGKVPKKYETKDIMEACRMTRFFIENTKADDPLPIESRTIMTQCFNFHRTIIGMNFGIKEHSSAIKKNQINKAVLLTKSEDTKITFMMDLKKPDYVFMLETPIRVARGMIFLNMEKTMEEVLKLL